MRKGQGTWTASTCVVLVTVAALATPVRSMAAAAQQTDAQLQRMRLLEQRLAELEAQHAELQQRSRQCAEELRGALERIKELEAALAEALAAKERARDPSIRDPGQDAPPDPANASQNPPAPGPLDNSAALLAAIRARFAADFAGKPAPKEGATDERLHRLWMTEIERWSNLLNRELRRPVIWTVRVRSYEASGRAYRLEVVCVDPKTHSDAGESFWIQLQSVQAGSWEQALRMGRGDSDFTLRGVLVPQVAINPSRYEAGPFDQPPFIGVFLEFGFRINVTSFIRVDDRPSPPGRRTPAQQSNTPQSERPDPETPPPPQPAEPPQQAPPPPSL